MNFCLLSIICKIEATKRPFWPEVTRITLAENLHSSQCNFKIMTDYEWGIHSLTIRLFKRNVSSTNFWLSVSWSKYKGLLIFMPNISLSGKGHEPNTMPIISPWTELHVRCVILNVFSAISLKLESFARKDYISFSSCNVYTCGVRAYSTAFLRHVCMGKHSSESIFSWRKRLLMTAYILLKHYNSE